MQIELLLNVSDPRTLNPTTSNIGIYYGTFKKNTSIMDIDLEFRGVDKNRMDTLSKANYCYIPSLKTYYHLRDIQFLEGNIVRFIGREDVLNTYKDDIKNMTCTIERQEFKYNLYLSDPLYKVYSYKRVQTFPFPSGFDHASDNFILSVQGRE